MAIIEWHENVHAQTLWICKWNELKSSDIDGSMPITEPTSQCAAPFMHFIKTNMNGSAENDKRVSFKCLIILSLGG